MTEKQKRTNGSLAIYWLTFLIMWLPFKLTYTQRVTFAFIMAFFAGILNEILRAIEKLNKGNCNG